MTSEPEAPAPHLRPARTTRRPPPAPLNSTGDFLAATSLQFSSSEPSPSALTYPHPYHPRLSTIAAADLDDGSFSPTSSSFPPPLPRTDLSQYSSDNPTRPPRSRKRESVLLAESVSGGDMASARTSLYLSGNDDLSETEEIQRVRELTADAVLDLVGRQRESVRYSFATNGPSPRASSEIDPSNFPSLDKDDFDGAEFHFVDAEGSDVQGEEDDTVTMPLAANKRQSGLYTTAARREQARRNRANGARRSSGASSRNASKGSQSWFARLSSLTGRGSAGFQTPKDGQSSDEEEDHDRAKKIKRESGASFRSAASSRASRHSVRSSVSSFRSAQSDASGWESAEDADEDAKQTDEGDTTPFQSEVEVGESDVGAALRKARRESALVDQWQYAPGREQFDAQMAKWAAILQASKGNLPTPVTIASPNPSLDSRSHSARGSRSSVSAAPSQSPNPSVFDSDNTKITPWSSPPSSDAAQSEEDGPTAHSKDATVVPSTPPREVDPWTLVRSASAGPALNTSLNGFYSVASHNGSPTSSSPQAHFQARIRPFSTDFTVSPRTGGLGGSKLARLSYIKGEHADSPNTLRERRQRRMTGPSSPPGTADSSTTTAESSHVGLGLGSPLRPRPRPHGKSQSYTEPMTVAPNSEANFGWRPRPLFLAPLRTRTLPGTPLASSTAPPSSRRTSVVMGKRLSIPLDGVIYEDAERFLTENQRRRASGSLLPVSVSQTSLAEYEDAEEGTDDDEVEALASVYGDAAEPEDEGLQPEIEERRQREHLLRSAYPLPGQLATFPAESDLPSIAIKSGTPTRATFREATPSIRSGSATPLASTSVLPDVIATQSFRSYYPANHASTRPSSGDSDSDDDALFVDADEASIYEQALDDDLLTAPSTPIVGPSLDDEESGQSLNSSRVSLLEVAFPQPPASMDGGAAQAEAARVAAAFAKVSPPTTPTPADPTAKSYFQSPNGDQEKRMALNKRRNAAAHALVIDVAGKASRDAGSPKSINSARSETEEAWRKQLIAALDKDAADMSQMLAGHRESQSRRSKRQSRIQPVADASPESDNREAISYISDDEVPPAPPKQGFSRSQSAPLLAQEREPASPTQTSHATGIRSTRRTSERSQTQFHLPSSVLVSDAARLRKNASAELPATTEDESAEAVGEMPSASKERTSKEQLSPRPSLRGPRSSEGRHSPQIPSRRPSIQTLESDLLLKPRNATRSPSIDQSPRSSDDVRGASPNGSIRPPKMGKRLSAASIVSGTSLNSTEETYDVYNPDGSKKRGTKRKSKRSSKAGGDVDLRNEAVVQMLNQRRSSARNSRHSLHSLQSLAPSANFIKACLGNSPGNIPEGDEGMSEAGTETSTGTMRRKSGFLQKMGDAMSSDKNRNKRSTTMLDPPTPILSSSRSSSFSPGSQTTLADDPNSSPRLSVRIQDRWGNVHQSSRAKSPQPLPVPAAVVLKPTPPASSASSTRSRSASISQSLKSMPNPAPAFPQHPFSGPVTPMRQPSQSSRSGPPVLIPTRGSSHAAPISMPATTPMTSSGSPIADAFMNAARRR